jgi:hypothetical protein
MANYFEEFDRETEDELEAKTKLFDLWVHNRLNEALKKSDMLHEYEMRKLRDVLDKVKEENARFRKALEKYADPKRHSMDKDGFLWSGDYFDYDTARAALDKKE